MPPLNMRILEFADPNSPYGLRGAGEPPTLSSTPAIVAAVRDACGLPLTRIPLRPEQIVEPLLQTQQVRGEQLREQQVREQQFRGGRDE
jgi:CO/xanthine dehydrogenase Mo-binding subunit